MNPLTFIHIVFAILSGMTPWHGETETQTERDVRLGIVATAITTASHGNRERAIALMVQAKSETHLARHIHEGRCEGHPNSFVGECDATWVRKSGRRIRVYRARNLWQVHSAPNQEARWLWDHALGSDLAATTNAARLADIYLRARRCGGNLAHMYSAQGGIGCVSTPRGLKRRALHYELRREWARLEAK